MEKVSGNTQHYFPVTDKKDKSPGDTQITHKVSKMVNGGQDPKLLLKVLASTHYIRPYTLAGLGWSSK